MTWFLGVDLGTTYTAAATLRDGQTSTVELGDRTAAIPTVVFLREDETILTGDAASRRGAADPSRVAREFKRRVGDTAPILLGGSPYSAEALVAKLLRWVVDTVVAREGSPPDGIAVTHPANWGPYKQDLLRQAIARADLDADRVVTITEPEAAVTFYASQERVLPGSVVAVYDLGGGTFDAAVVRKTADGVEVLGTPEGIERLGGVDFDEAVFSHVVSSLSGAVDGLDADDPAVTAALVRLRAESIEAKEALSADTEVVIPVFLPGVPSTEVRLTRAELEAMIRPPLADSITAMRRALRSAGVEASDLHAVLLAGGSSRIPLVAQLVGAELGRPVAVDAHPKYGVALGAAQAAGAAAGAAVPSPPAAPSGAAGGAGAAGAAGAAGLAGLAGAAAGVAAGAAWPPPPASSPSASGPPPTEPVGYAEPAAPAPALRGFDPADPGLAAETVDMRSAGGDFGDAPTQVEAGAAATEVYPDAPAPGPAFAPPLAPTPAAGEQPFRPLGDSDRDRGAGGGAGDRRRVLIVAGLVVAALVLGVGAVLAFGGGDDGGPTTDDTTTTTGPFATTTSVPPATEAPAPTEGGDPDPDSGGGEETTPTTSPTTTTSSTTTTSTTTTSTTTTTIPDDTTTTTP